MSDNDELIFADETPHSEDPKCRPWKLLVVDDDEFVHKVTALVLQDYTFEGCGVELIPALSAAEGREKLMQHPDTAVILLDVVMETNHAGLDFAQWVRETLDNKMVRIILRTGQPGEAPEQEVIFKYDINDYKEKAELTSQKLATTVTTAIRSFRDIRTIERHRTGLAQIVSASPTIFRSQSLSEFASGVLTQLASTISLDDDSLIARAAGVAAAKENGRFKVMASTGKFEKEKGHFLDEIEDREALENIERAAREKQSFFTDKAFVGYYRTVGGSESVIYLKGGSPIDLNDQKLVEIFSSNISVAFDNLDLNRMISETQRELLFTLGEVVETRSSETANHVRRVAEYSHLLGLKSGMSEQDAERFKLASPMHDVGKIGIPDAILLKPGKLTDEEFETIKSHTTIGYDILKGTDRPVMQMAATAALQHHERWDGTGYPNGLKGEAIELVGRITMIADVFDALGTDRVYKQAWPLPQILDFLREQSGLMFDPRIVDLFMENIDAILDIRQKFPDDSE